MSLNFDILTWFSHLAKGRIIYYTSKFCSIVHMEMTTQFAKSYTTVSLNLCTIIVHLVLMLMFLIK